jgi:transposase, IS30 family
VAAGPGGGGAGDRAGYRPGAVDGVAGAAAERVGVAASVPGVPGAHPGQGAGAAVPARKLVRGSEVARLLARDYSPGQVGGRLRREHPDDKAMRVRHETIYQALFVQGKGSLRAEVAEALRCGRARKRRPRMGNHTGRTRIAGLSNISERPPRRPTGLCPGTGKAT